MSEVLQIHISYYTSLLSIMPTKLFCKGKTHFLLLRIPPCFISLVRRKLIGEANICAKCISSGGQQPRASIRTCTTLRKKHLAQKFWEAVLLVKVVSEGDGMASFCSTYSSVRVIKLVYEWVTGFRSLGLVRPFFQ
jgi:hypothetical protein